MLHPALDLAIAALAGVAMGGYARCWALTPALLIGTLTLAATILGIGWVCCAVMLRRLRGAAIPGFARGFPTASANVLMKVAVQSFAITLVAVGIGLAGHAGWIAIPWVLLVSVAIATTAGLVRWIEMITPLTRVVLPRATERVWVGSDPRA